MISCFQVKEQSMEPWAREGDFVVGERMSYLFSRPKVGHVVIVKHPKSPNTLLLKRIIAEKKDSFWVEGDNAAKSTDSRHFGWLGREYIIGKVMIRVGNPAPEQSSVRDCARQGKFGSLELSTRQPPLTLI